MSSINSNNTTGIVYNSDATGTLQLQTVGNTAINMDVNQNVTLANNLVVTGNITQGGTALPNIATVLTYSLAF